MRRRHAHCSMDYDAGPFGAHVSGSAKWVRQEFPKLVALIRKLQEAQQ